MTLYTCEFPLPPRACSPNVKPGSIGSRMGQAEATKRYREDCRLIARKAIIEGRLPKCADKATVHLRFYCAQRRDKFGRPDKRLRPLDCANGIGATKGLVDSLVDAGVLVADDHRHLSIGRVALYRRAEEHKGRCCIEVTLEVVE